MTLNTKTLKKKHSLTLVQRNKTSPPPYPDFSTFMNNTEFFPDCIVRFKDKPDILCHKVFLSQSPVFRTYFNSGLCRFENNICVYTIEDGDDDPKIMEMIIKWLYNPNTPTKCSRNLVKLIILADKYELKTLVESASSLLSTGLNMWM